MPTTKKLFSQSRSVNSFSWILWFFTNFYEFLKEEERLAAVVHLITDEFVAPRRAFMKSAEGIVTRNPSYRGLNPAETAHVTNWFHFRPTQTKKPDIKQQAHIDPAIGKLCSNCSGLVE